MTDGEELKKEDVKIAVENLNKPDESSDTNSAELPDAIRVEAENSKEFNGNSHIIPEENKNGLWELIQTGTISEITSHITLMRYQAENSHCSKQDIAKSLQISVPTLDKYCALAEGNSEKNKKLHGD